VVWREPVEDDPAGSEVDVWAIPLDETSGRLIGVQLSAGEAERAEGIRTARDRSRFVTSRLWLRRLLADRLAVSPEVIVYGASVLGKPELVSPPRSDLQFSLSRSGVWCVCAIAAARPVGVDVEECAGRPDLGRTERRFFSDGERASLAGLSGADRLRGFYRIWARKEAVLKAAGVGLAGEWAALDTTKDVVTFADGSWPLPSAAVSGSWSVRDLPMEPGYAAAISLRGRFGDPLRLRRAGVVGERAGAG